MTTDNQRLSGKLKAQSRVACSDLLGVMSILDIKQLCSGGNNCLLNLVCDANLLSSHRCLDGSLLQKLEALELLIRHLRARLQNLHESLSCPAEANANVAGLVAISDGDGLRKIEVVQQERGVGIGKTLGTGEIDRQRDGINAANVVDGDGDRKGTNETI